MADIATTWTYEGGDWTFNAPGLLQDAGLQTAVVLSLFTDRRAEPDDLADVTQATTDAVSIDGPFRRGWWGDAYAERRADYIGSRLWLLAREKLTPDVLRRAQDYAQEALGWLIEDGIARSVQVLAEVAGDTAARGLLALTVTIVRSAQPVTRYRFEAFWKGE